MRWLWVVGLALGLSREAIAAPFTANAADGVVLHGNDWGKGTKAVLLVHEKGKSSLDWSYFAERLSQKGFYVAAIDLRGHGTSTLPAPLTEADYPKMSQDVAAGLAFLRAKGAKDIVIIGAGIGANVSLYAASEAPDVKTVVLMSPGLNLTGVAIAPAAEKYGTRPMLIAVGADDTYGLRTATWLEERGQGSRVVEFVGAGGQGVKLLNKDPDLEGTLIAWISGNYAQVDVSQRATPASTTAPATFTTTGKKLGEE